MTLSCEDVAKVARLAKLQLSDEEVQASATELANILAYIEQLGEVDTTDVEPLAGTSDLVNVFREDKCRPSLSVEDALAAAPKSDGHNFLVPPVLEQ